MNNLDSGLTETEDIEPNNENNKSKCFSVQLEISLNFEIQNRILKKFLVNFLTISGSSKDFSGFLLTKWGGGFFWGIFSEKI